MNTAVAIGNYLFLYNLHSQLNAWKNNIYSISCEY